MYAVGRIEINEDETANFEIINTTILEYNLAEGLYNMLRCTISHYRYITSG